LPPSSGTGAAFSLASGPAQHGKVGQEPIGFGGVAVSDGPRAGHGVGAGSLLAEIGDVRERFPDPQSLMALAGAAPVTRASGKRRVVSFRWACDKKLRAAVVDFADDSRHDSAWARRICERPIAKGHTHPHAVRILARAWLRVIWRCWQDGVAYDVTKHRGAAAPIAA